VSRWIAERPGIDRDEFIDDIPFPETQNYVKRILGTAEDYRRIYGSGALRADQIDATPAVSSRPGAPPKPAKASASPAKKKAAPVKKKKSTARKNKKAA
jgi:soluble lytic murein transglycosylase